MTITVAPAIPSTAPQFVSDDAFTSAVLNSTNLFRTQHNATSVTYNETLAQYASDYLNTGDSDNDDDDACPPFEHSGGPYGENLALGCSDVQGCVDMWGNERSMYNFDDPQFGMDTGHFTQLVWKNTTDVGCGRKLCGGNRGWYLVCEYWPRGNVIGQFPEEVGRQVTGVQSAGHPTLAVGLTLQALLCLGVMLLLML
ncbi:CAP domain-containing protein [Podospora didyma]|uniref:CAP domain-containing protein n=1 Tax=Podospora didyma TaxID=330526 RepID=A0AAE0P888_9PEZI|nr:CAP domain-containing protein [Podospora didyma]